MNKPPAPTQARPCAPDAARVLAQGLGARLDAILAPLALLVAARFRLLGHWTNPLWTRLNRASRRLANLLAALAAGRLPRPRHRPARRGGPPGIRLPRRRAWLVVTIGYEAAGFASQLQHLLHDPAVAATLAATLAAVPTAARTLRPLCRLLGIELPPALEPPAKPKTPPRQPRPRAEPRPPCTPPRPLLPGRKPPPIFLRFRPA